MNTLERSIIELVKSGIDGSKAVISEDVDWEKLIQICKTHKLVPLVYYGIINSDIKVSNSLLNDLKSMVFRNVVVDQRQLLELSQLQKQFDNYNIDYMPLKGILLKYLYPRTEMRPMGDGDILIKMSQRQKVKEIMLEMGYEEGKETYHELVFKKPNIYVELHKCLIPSYNKDYYSYYGDGWKLARKINQSSSCYSMSDEDQLIFLFTHFAKHYRDGGISVLHLIDIWVYLNSKNISNDYVIQELSKLQLDRFYNNILSTLEVWFNNGDETKITEFITNRMFNNGCWGTQDTNYIATAVKTTKSSSVRGIKVKRIINVIFPSVAFMKFRYPVLQKCKYLLPVTWIMRWIETIILKPQNLKAAGKALNNTTEENVIAYQNELNYVGLDFNFEE